MLLPLPGLANEVGVGIVVVEEARADCEGAGVVVAEAVGVDGEGAELVLVLLAIALEELELLATV